MPQTTKSPIKASGSWRTGCFLAAALLYLSACSSSPEVREAKYMKRGRTELAAKEYKKAVIDFKVAAQNMPKDAEPVYQLGMTYLSAGAARQAVEAFTRAVTLNPKHEGAQYQMALVKVGSNKPEIVQDSKQVLLAYLARHPGDGDAMGSLALAEAKLGDKAEALKMLDAAADKNPSNMRPAATIIALYAARGDVDTAKQIARELADRLPNSPDAAILRAQVSLAMHDTADTDAQIGRALALKRDFRPALELRLRRELMNQNGAGAEETTQELSKLPQKRMWAAYARMLFAERKIDQGIAEFNRVLKEHNDDADVRDDYSSSLMSARRGAEAESVVAATLKKNPKDRTALLQRATLEIDKGDLDGAAGDVKTLQELKAFSPQLSYQESRIFGARGQTIKEGDLLAEALKANPRLLTARLELSRVLTAAGNPRVALETLEQANATEKRTAEFVFYHNTALMGAGDWTEARKGVDAALRVVRTPGFLYQDAVLRIREHDLAGARKSLEAGLQLAPNDSATLNLLGEIMKQQKQGPEYLAMVKEAAAKNPGSATLQDTLGAQLLIQGDKDGARAAFGAAKTAGDPVNADIEIARIDIRAGALDQARQRLLDLVKKRDNTRARMMLAEIETKKGSPADVVIQDYLKALQFEPTNIVAMNNLADFLASRQSKFDDALFWAQKALAQAPASPVIEDTLGWIYYRQGKYDTALPYLEKSLKSLDRPVAHYHLAAALFKAGDAARGRKEYEIALKQDPKSDARGPVGPLFDHSEKK
jgi:tetratricopeptide (TPR) repeat protein